MQSCMQARHRHTFRPGVAEVFFDNATLESDSYQSLNFSSIYWQPFIDKSVDRETGFTSLAGPLLGFLLEFVKKYKFVILYTEAWAEDGTLYDGLVDESCDVFLFPTPLLDMPFWQQIQPSSTLGVVHMISTLSTKFPAPKQLFNFFQCFSPACWLGILASFLTSSLVAMAINSVWRQNGMARKLKSRLARERFRPFLTHLRCLLDQPMQIQLRQLTASQWLVAFLWQLSSLVLIMSFLTKLLEFTVFPETYITINSLEDLAKFIKNDLVRRILTMEGESFHDFIQRDSKLAKALKPHTKFFNEAKDVLEKDVLPLIGDGSVVFVADDAWLDYYFNAFLHKYPNLYRSKQNLVPLPYVMPLMAKKPELNQFFNHLIQCLVESGIYQQWIDETLLANNLAMKLNLKESDGERASLEPLNVSNFFGLLILFVAGSILATLSFVIEINFSKRSNKICSQNTKTKKHCSTKMNDGIIKIERDNNISISKLVCFDQRKNINVLLKPGTLLDVWSPEGAIRL